MEKPEQLWNAVEAAEKQRQPTGKRICCRTPIELDKDSNISLLQNFIQKNFVDMGMCADFAIHDTDGHNPHAHILLTVRPLNENGTWQYKTEKEYLSVKDGEEKDLLLLNLKLLRNRDGKNSIVIKLGKESISDFLGSTGERI